MTEHACIGLDGSSPLHMLAALGLVRLLEHEGLDPRMGWVWHSGSWVPRFAVARDMSWLCSHVARRLAELGEVAPPPGDDAGGRTAKDLGRDVRDLGAQLKKATETLKKRGRAAAAEARERRLRGDEKKHFLDQARAAQERDVARLRKLVEALESQRAEALGEGVAHLGDKIGVPVATVRRAFDRALGRWWKGESQRADGFLLDQLAGLCCDGVAQDGVVLPTPFSFSNGGSGQLLLKDFRGCAARCEPGRVEATLLGRPDRTLPPTPGVTGLNWDPAGQRRRALMWEDPGDSGNREGVDVAANALAYLGLGMLPAVPAGRGLTAVGWGPGNCWSWPIWDPLLPIEVVRSLLADPEVVRQEPEARTLRHRGVVEVRRSERISVEKRFYFAPSATA